MSTSKTALTPTDLAALDLFKGGLGWQFRSGTGIDGRRARVSTLDKLIGLGLMESTEDGVPAWALADGEKFYRATREGNAFAGAHRDELKAAVNLLRRKPAPNPRIAAADAARREEAERTWKTAMQTFPTMFAE